MIPIANRYQRGDPLGSGAMGDVYLAADTQTGETVAIKALKPEIVKSSPGLVERFRREGEALRDLDHPNIVTLLDVVEQGGGHYLVMEYVPGGDLHALLDASPGGLPLDRALTIALELADALTRAHHLGIIHRDLKPANVLLAADGTPRLSDFGFAHFVDRDSLTHSGDVIGTLYYLSPEAIMDEALDEQADIWSFGVLVYEMLAGRRPFGGTSPAAVFNAILNNPLPDLSELREDVPDALVDIVYRMLDKSRDSRVPTIRLVGAELEALIRGIDLKPTTKPAEQSVFAPPTTGITERPRHNLPRQTLPFVGRETELSELARLLTDPDQPLITILGPGGMGKSRLALEAAERNLDSFRNGAFFVELAALSDPANISSAIAGAASVQLSGEGTPREQILNYLSNKELLLILDNFEHLLAGTELVTEILERAPEVAILVTSREKLSLSGETAFVLDPLDFPDWETPEDALTYSAVQLFMQSARRARIDFKLTAENLDYVARICRLAGGIPLGILLAGAWVDTLSPQEIADEITQSIDFLEADLRDLPDRQRSMRAAFDYSWKMLNDEEQAAFARMSVFWGGCTREAAQTVTGTSLRMLTALVNKSLLRRDAESGRFHIHELLRQLGEEHLEKSGDANAIRDAHCAYYAEALGQREAALKGHGQIEALKDITSDIENVRAMWAWALKSQRDDDLDRALGALHLYYHVSGHLVEGEEIYDQAVKVVRARPGAPEGLLGKLLTRCAYFYMQPGRSEETRVLAVESAAIARRCVDRYEEALALLFLGYALTMLNRFNGGRQHLEKSLVIFETSGDRWGTAWSLLALGNLSMSENVEESLAFYRRSLALHKEIGELRGMAITLRQLGVLFMASAEYSQAIDYLEECIAIAQKLDNRYVIIAALQMIGEVSEILGEYAQARDAVHEHLILAEELSLQQDINLGLDQLGLIDLLEGNLEEAEKNLTRAGEAAQQTGDQYSLAWHHFFLGLLAFEQKQYDQARQYAQQARDADFPWLDTHSRQLLGLVACAQGNMTEGRKVLGEALERAFVQQAQANTLLVIYAVGVLLDTEGQHERAVELLALVEHHKATEHYYRVKAGQQLAELKAKLPAKEFASACERGKALDLDVVTQELLEEFGEGEDK